MPTKRSAPEVILQQSPKLILLVLFALLVTACNPSGLLRTLTTGTSTPRSELLVSTPTVFSTNSLSSSASSLKSVVVQRRDGDLTILPKGDVAFAETWEVHFVGGPYRNAYRWISLAGISDITKWGLSEAGQAYLETNTGEPQTFWVSQQNGNETVRWYFPETTDQTRTFILRYTLNGAIRLTPNTSEFFWKFIESDRAYTINSSNVIVHLPSAFQTNQIAATTYQDAVERLGAYVIDGESVGFNGGPFAAGVEWEIRVQYPH